MTGPAVAGTGAAPALIELAGVEKTYRSAEGRGRAGGRGVGFRALNGVDLAIAAGEMVAITGPSGSVRDGLIVGDTRGRA